LQGLQGQAEACGRPCKFNKRACSKENWSKSKSYLLRALPEAASENARSTKREPFSPAWPIKSWAARKHLSKTELFFINATKWALHHAHAGRRI
jgi:hypothetical protein